MVSRDEIRCPVAKILGRGACGLALAVWLLAPLPVAAWVELYTPVEEFPPTSEDLNGIAAAPSGEMIAVGDGATVLRRVVDAGGSPVWSSLGVWAGGFFTAEIFDVAHSPVAYPNGDGWVVAGRNGVVETDFTTTTEVDLRPGSGKVFTPVLPTVDEIWYGVPDLGIFPSFLHRYDRATQTAPGIAFSLGAILAMCDVPGGDLRYVTTDGDIEEINDSLQVTVLYNQDDSDPLELNAATFSDDCEVIAAGDTGPESRIYVGSISLLRRAEEGASPWQFQSRNGEPVVTASCFLTEYEQRNTVAYFFGLMRCEDSAIETGDEATMEAFGDLFDSRIGRIESFNRDSKCQRDAGLRDPFSFPRARGAASTSDFEMVTVGTGGRVQRVAGSIPLFYDDFETADLSRWSASSQLGEAPPNL